MFHFISSFTRVYYSLSLSLFNILTNYTILVNIERKKKRSFSVRYKLAPTYPARAFPIIYVIISSEIGFTCGVLETVK